MEKDKKTNLFLWIKTNWQFALLGVGILYILIIGALSLYNQSLQPKLISYTPENKEKGVILEKTLEFEFDRKINNKDFIVNITPNLSDSNITVEGSTLKIGGSLLKKETIYFIEIFYKEEVMLRTQFATEGTSILTLMGLKAEHKGEFFEVFIDQSTVVAYVRQEPYEENKILTEKFLKEEYPEQFDSFRITWIAPLPEEQLTWDDLTREVPDGAP